MQLGACTWRNPALLHVKGLGYLHTLFRVNQGCGNAGALSSWAMPPWSWRGHVYM
jgi:hypothetical protein